MGVERGGRRGEAGIGDDLLSEIGCGVEDRPREAVEADGQRTLAPKRNERVAPEGGPPVLIWRIPLREASAGSGPEYQGASWKDACSLRQDLRVQET